MKQTIKINLGTTFPIQKAPEDPERTLKQVGTLLSSAAQKAFKDQKFGNAQWEPRYPNQSEPFVNIAGAIQDLSKGPNIKPRRFERRPALRDTGNLVNSLDANRSVSIKGQHTVEVGTTVPYASAMMFGGETQQTITDAMRTNFRKLQKRAFRSLGKADTFEKIRSTAGKIGALEKLGRILERDTLVTQVVARPFLGVTEDLSNKIARAIRRDIPKVVK